MTDTWKTIDNVSVKAVKTAKALERSAQQKVFADYIAFNWPRVRKDFIEAATSKYIYHKKREFLETENPNYDLKYEADLKFAVNRATIKSIDCGLSVQQCRNFCKHNSRCDANRLWYFNDYMENQDEYAFDDEPKLYDPSAPPEQKTFIPVQKTKTKFSVEVRKSKPEVPTNMFDLLQKNTSSDKGTVGPVKERRSTHLSH
jgi:hypothetical protein